MLVSLKLNGIDSILHQFRQADTNVGIFNTLMFTFYLSIPKGSVAYLSNLYCFSDDRSQTVLPLVKSFCEKSFKADESILVSLSFHLGKLCNGLYGMIKICFTLFSFSFFKRSAGLFIFGAELILNYFPMK